MVKENAIYPAANIMTVDVEDWFHILDTDATPGVNQWTSLESRVEANTDILLGLFDEYGVKVTCFVLGWIAERFPRLVEKIAGEGHEVASHGYAHQLVTSLSPAQFRDDIRRARQLLEDSAQVTIAGYRAPGFSLTKSNLWVLEILQEEGYEYDASLFPGWHGHGGIPDAPMAPFLFETSNGRIAEFPMTQASFAGLRACFSGGGYLRLLPSPVIAALARQVAGQRRPVVYYIHPREIDPDQPRLAISPVRRFKTYVNLTTMKVKLQKILREGHFMPMHKWLISSNLNIQKLM